MLSLVFPHTALKIQFSMLGKHPDKIGFQLAAKTWLLSSVKSGLTNARVSPNVCECLRSLHAPLLH